jgi:hypothetical protein
MPNKYESNWDPLEHIDFTVFPVLDKVKVAIGVVRDAPKPIPGDSITSADFFGDMREILSAAIWKDVKHAILIAGGPGVPEHVEFKGGPPLPLSIENLANALGKTYPDQYDQTSMLLVVLRCASERIAVVREALLHRPEDWWLRLILVDILSEMKSVF